jgi:RNA polymerase sigma factor (sigma-70 family)
MENAAILCLQSKSRNQVRKLIRDYGLPPETADDILNQSILIFLRKIKDGSYQFQHNAPSTYLIEIARRLALMARRLNKIEHEPLENHQNVFDADVEAAQKRREASEILRLLLGQLGHPCQDVIRLHHIEGYSDEEVVQQKLTKYSTIDSLKVKRSDCMKKLIQIAQHWKISNNT